MVSKLNLAPNECSCDTCKEMCRRPCWGTPEDAKKIIDAGYGHRLMRDFWGGENGDQNTEILCPALKGHEGQKAPFFPRSPDGCTFWKDGLCELHDLGLKPTEGKLATCNPKIMDDDGEISLHEEIYMTWKNPEAEKFVEEWEQKHMGEPEEDDPIMLILELLQGMADCIRDRDGIRKID